MNKPPLGIIPEKLWKEERLLELHLAIIRATHLYVENRISPLSYDWCIEFGKIAKELKETK